MFIVFFLVHLFFAGIFFLLQAPVEAILFCILGLVAFFFFWPFRPFDGKRSQDISVSSEISPPLVSTAKAGTLRFFQSGILPTSIFLFYTAILGILTQVMENYIDIIHMFLLIGGGGILVHIFCLYFRVSLRQIFEDILRIHLHATFIFFILFLLLLLFKDIPLSEPLLISAASLFPLGYLVQMREMSLSKTYSASSITLIYVFIYLLGLRILHAFGVSSTAVVLAMSATFYAISTFEGIMYVPKVSLQRIVRAISLILLYVSSISLIVLMYLESSITIILFLLGSLFFNLYVHRRFENYPSLILALSIPISIVFSYLRIPENFFSFLVLMLVFTYGLTLVGRIFRSKHTYDEYIVQTVAIGLAVVLTGMYAWWFSIFGILHFSLLLLFFSGLFFISYLQIRK